MKLREAAGAAGDGCVKTLTYTRFPREHWKRIRTNNAIERLNYEMRRHTHVVGIFPDERSALIPVTTGPRLVAGSSWGLRCYLDVTLLEGAVVPEGKPRGLTESAQES